MTQLANDLQCRGLKLNDALVVAKYVVMECSNDEPRSETMAAEIDLSDAPSILQRAKTSIQSMVLLWLRCRDSNQSPITE